MSVCLVAVCLVAVCPAKWVFYMNTQGHQQQYWEWPLGHWVMDSLYEDARALPEATCAPPAVAIILGSLWQWDLGTLCPHKVVLPLPWEPSWGSPSGPGSLFQGLAKVTSVST